MQEPLASKIDGMEGRFAEEKVEERGIVGLYDEEEDLLCRNSEERRA